MKKSQLNTNIVHTAYCPHCMAVKNLSVSISLRTIPAPGGTTETLISRTYHCESCRSFIRSEDDVSLPAEKDKELVAMGKSLPIGRHK